MFEFIKTLNNFGLPRVRLRFFATPSTARNVTDLSEIVNFTVWLVATCWRVTFKSCQRFLVLQIARFWLCIQKLKNFQLFNYNTREPINVEC